MEIEVKQRGYDDSSLLKKMADGLVLREFSSVDEAARAVLSEESGSNVDRLRRKFREQDWYQKGLQDYVDEEIKTRGLITPNFGARFCVAAEHVFRNPVQAFWHLVLIVHVLALRRFDIDGRRVTVRERLGGMLRIVGAVTVSVAVMESFVYLVRMDAHRFGWEMLRLSFSFFVLWMGMCMNRQSISGDIRGYAEADNRWRRLQRERIIAMVEPDEGCGQRS